MKDIVSQLSENRIRIWLVIDIPIGVELNPVAAFVANPNAPEFGSITYNAYLKTKKREQDLFDSLSRTYIGVNVVDPSFNLCDSDNCFGGKGNVVWYRDGDHLTDAGAKAAMSQFHPIFFVK